MINTELIKECLDVIDLKYAELDDGGIAVTFYDEEFFPYQVVTFIRVADDRLLTFSTRAVDFHPEGDLLAMCNRHNCRCHAPAAYIDDDGDVVMDRAFVLEDEVSPHFVLNCVVRPSIFLPMESFVNFTLSDDELEEKCRRQQ